MNIRISHSKTGETRLDYIHVRDKQNFRYYFLNRVIEGDANQAVLIIDTNQCMNKKSSTGTLYDELREAGVEPIALRITANSESFFGLQVNLWSKNQIEYLICIELKGKPLTKEIFALLSHYDIAVGLEQKEPFYDQCGLVYTDSTQLISTCFEKRLYDSIICSRINSNIDIEQYAKDIPDEMGL